ncbi:MAG: hypothetical protein D6740_12180 [Alphaproteobacteria bacterium]|nr:MAG: hypothetical protein D6740_12180 [Alphaproteobacteria bacterium]
MSSGNGNGQQPGSNGNNGDGTLTAALMQSIAWAVQQGALEAVVVTGLLDVVVGAADGGGGQATLDDGVWVLLRYPRDVRYLPRCAEGDFLFVSREAEG